MKPSLLVQGQGWGPTLQPLIPSRLCARSALKSARESIALLTRVNPRLAAQCRAVSPVKGLRLFNAVASIWRHTLCPLKKSQNDPQFNPKRSKTSQNSIPNYPKRSNTIQNYSKFNSKQTKTSQNERIQPKTTTASQPNLF